MQELYIVGMEKVSCLESVFIERERSHYNTLPSSRTGCRVEHQAEL